MPIQIDPPQGLVPEFQKAYQTAVQAEQKAVQTLAEKKEKIQARVGLLNEVLGHVDSLKQMLPAVGTPFAIRDLAFNSDDPKIVTGTADKSLAVPSKHSFEVLQLASGPSAITNGFEDRDDTRVGTGYVRFTTAQGDTREIFIDYDNSTLDGIAASINGAGLGLNAVVIMDGSDEEHPYRLLVSTPEVGEGADVNYPEFYFAGGEEDFYIESERDATNAKLRYKGFEVESPSNEIKDLIQGATLNLKGVTEPGRPTTVTIAQDIPATTVKIKDIVDKLNSVFGFIQNQNKMDDKTDTSRTLGGDYGIRLAESRIKTALQENYLGDTGRTIQTLNDLGIQITKNGTLSFDEKKFQNALEKNYDQAVDFLTGDGRTTGVMTKLSDALNSISSPSGRGVLSNQRKNYTDQMGGIDRRIEQTEKQAKTKLDNLKNQLARAQSAMSQLQGQTGYFQGTASFPGLQ